MKLFVVVVSLFSIVAAQNCLLPTETEIENEIRELFFVEESESNIGPVNLSSPVQYTCQISLYNFLSIIALYTNSTTGKTSRFQLQCYNSVWYMSLSDGIHTNHQSLSCLQSHLDFTDAGYCSICDCAGSGSGSGSSSGSGGYSLIDVCCSYFATNVSCATDDCTASDYITSNSGTNFICNITDEKVGLPSANIEEYTQYVATFQDFDIQLNCTGIGTLRWYRNNLSENLDNYTQLMEDNTLVLILSNVTENIDATRDGIPYFCTASNLLGTVRSRSVLVIYSYFGGFYNNTNTTITVREGEAVALECTVLPSVPTPNIIWYIDDQLISDVPVKYALVDQYLVIYNLTSSDVASNYSCAVDNVELDKLRMSPVVYSLLSTSTIPGDNYIIYREPVNKTVNATYASIVFYFIGATTGGTEIISYNLTEENIDSDLLRFTVPNMGKSKFIDVFLLSNDSIASKRTIGFTVTEPLLVTLTPLDFLSNDSVIFRELETKSINFTCTANGTNVSLTWYFNGRALSINTSTLELTNLTTNHSGIYQCMWQGVFQEDYNSTSWALVVQAQGTDPIQTHPLQPSPPSSSLSESSSLLLLPLSSSSLELTLSSSSPELTLSSSSPESTPLSSSSESPPTSSSPELTLSSSSPELTLSSSSPESTPLSSSSESPPTSSSPELTLSSSLPELTHLSSSSESLPSSSSHDSSPLSTPLPSSPSPPSSPSSQSSPFSPSPSSPFSPLPSSPESTPLSSSSESPPTSSSPELTLSSSLPELTPLSSSSESLPSSSSHDSSPLSTPLPSSPSPPSSPSSQSSPFSPSPSSPFPQCFSRNCDTCDDNNSSCCSVCTSGYTLSTNNCDCDRSNDELCNKDSTVTSSPDRGTFEWPTTPVGNTAMILCPYGPSNVMATRTCQPNSTWSQPNIESCATILAENFSKIVQINITNETATAVSQNLTTIVTQTNDTADRNVDNIQVISSVLTQIATLASEVTLPLQVVETITENAISVIDTVGDWPPNVVKTQSNTIVQAFEEITFALVTAENFTNITIINEDIAFCGERIERNLFSGVTFSVTTVLDNDLSIESQKGTIQSDLDTNEIASISVPQSIVDILNETDPVNIAFVIYEQPTLFPVRGGITINSTKSIEVGSAVVNTNISGILTGTQLSDNITISLVLRKHNSSENVDNLRCVYWNFTAADGQGNWSTDGCFTSFNVSEPTYVMCSCNHLTNFAILVDISSRVGTPVFLNRSLRVSLDVLNYVGVILSLVGLTLTVITFIIFKKLRERDISKFHIQLCISLFGMLLVFVAGIDKLNPIEGCIVVGVLIHYFALVTWMWMGAEALLMFQKLVIVFDAITWRYILIVSIICWALPLLPVIISVAINPNFYFTNNTEAIVENITTNVTVNVVPGYCYISNQVVFFGGFLVPIIIILIFNFIIYFLIVRNLVLLKRRKNKHLNKSTTTKEFFELILTFTAISTSFGLTWLFGVFTFISSNDTVYYIVQVLFTLFNVSQGFFIFFFFVIVNKDSRDAWKSLICIKKQNVPKKAINNQSSKMKTSAIITEVIMNESVLNGSDKFKKSIDDQVHFEEMKFHFDRFNLERQSTIRRTHHVEKVDVYFFDDFESDTEN